LNDATTPSIDRRGFGIRLAAAALTALVGTTVPTSAKAQEPEPAPGTTPEKAPETEAKKEPRPGIDSPLDMATVTVPDHVYDEEAVRKPIEKAGLGLFSAPSAGSALQVAALAVEKVGRENIPEGHVMMISVTGAKGEREFVIDPAKVPRSDFDQRDYDEAIRGPNRDADLADFVESLSRGRLGIELSVSGKRLGDDPSVTFEFVKRGYGTPATLSVQFIDPATIRAAGPTE
jgi:hypothetical protein